MDNANHNSSDKYDDDSDAPLPLTDLRNCVSPKTFLWLQDAEEKSNDNNEENEEDDDEYDIAAAALFASFGQNGEGSDDYGEEEEERFLRVQEWYSSVNNPNGIGGTSSVVSTTCHNYDNTCSLNKSHGHNYMNEKNDDNDDDRDDDKCKVVRVKYILSTSAGGHGDDLWAAARHVANLFAHPVKCRDLLSPLLNHDGGNGNGDGDQEGSNLNHHPLYGRSVIELGSGAGVPSWTAMKCGAGFVMCTDQAIPDRIRCMAESAERNLRDMRVDVDLTDGKVCAGPHDWGTPVDDLLEFLNEDEGNTNNNNTTIAESQMKAEEVPQHITCKTTTKKNKFDVCIAADCIYIPQCHEVLLQSIQNLMSYPHGMALLPFALHGNTNDENVWGIVPLAQGMGMHVEVLKDFSEQLTPQSYNMDQKRGLVHMIRLTHGHGYEQCME